MPLRLVGIATDRNDIPGVSVGGGGGGKKPPPPPQPDKCACSTAPNETAK